MILFKEEKLELLLPIYKLMNILPTKVICQWPPFFAHEPQLNHTHAFIQNNMQKGAMHNKFF